MKISVITPTRDRHALLPRLYAHFQRQSYADKELLVLDDSQAPSEWMTTLDDRRVRYMHSRQPMPLGEKRNALAAASTGEIVAHFDDDDFYHAEYLSSAACALAAYDFVTLSAWLVFHTSSSRLFYWDCRTVADLHFRLAGREPISMVRPSRAAANINDWIDMQVWGYGFSYVFKKDVWTAIPFRADARTGEDIEFARDLRRAGWRAAAIPDVSGAVIHAVHGANASAVFPNYSLPLFALDKLTGADAVRWARDLCGSDRDVTDSGGGAV